jgi:transmembrane sensor
LGVSPPIDCPVGSLLALMGQEHKEYTWNLIAKKLTGEATAEELRELESLLRNNPELHYPMQTIGDLWKSKGRSVKKEAEIAFNRHLDRIQELKIDYNPVNTQDPDLIESEGYGQPRTETDSRRRSVLFTIAGLILAMGACVWIYNRPSRLPAVKGQIANVNTLNGKEIFTSSGSRTHLTLPDGTLVWLNAGSRITYDKNYGGAFREVNLTGEAFFDVAKNADKPFLIHTARIDIKVLGTRFNVKSYPLDKTTEATLLRGSIEVSIKARPSEKIILKPNEKLIVNNDDSTLHRSSVPPQNARPESLVSIRQPTYETTTGAVIETSWVDDRLAFQDEEFGILAKDMERWYGVTIRFTNTAQEQWHFTGNFQKETIQQALDALKLTATFTYTIHENQITIYDR